MGIEPVILSSGERLKQNALALRPPFHTKEGNKGKYIDRRCSNDVTRQKIMHKLQKFEYQLHIYSSISMNYKRLVGWL